MFISLLDHSTYTYGILCFFHEYFSPVAVLGGMAFKAATTDRWMRQREGGEVAAEPRGK